MQLSDAIILVTKAVISYYKMILASFWSCGHFIVEIMNQGGKSELFTGWAILKGTDHDFPGQENPFIILRSKEINIYSKNK